MRLIQNCVFRNMHVPPSHTYRTRVFPCMGVYRRAFPGHSSLWMMLFVMGKKKKDSMNFKYTFSQPLNEKNHAHFVCKIHFKYYLLLLWRRDSPVFRPGEFHGQRRLAGYSPWHRKESDTTEGLTLLLAYTFLSLSFCSSAISRWHHCSPCYQSQT